MGLPDQTRDEGAEQSLAPAASVVDELEEAEIERQLLLRDAPVRAQPGAQQGPEALGRVDVDLAEAVPVVVARVLAAGVADRLVAVAPLFQAAVDVVLVGVHQRALRGLAALLPVLSQRGISPGAFREALAALLGKEAPNLSPPVIARLRSDWQAEHERWQRRDLSARRYVYIWAAGVHLQARMEPQAECMLVVIGATPEGRKELVGFQVGTRESAQGWRELLVGLKARGLAIAPELAVGDGALGFWKALEEVF